MCRRRLSARRAKSRRSRPLIARQSHQAKKEKGKKKNLGQSGGVCLIWRNSPCCLSGCVGVRRNKSQVAETEDGNYPFLCNTIRAG